MLNSPLAEVVYCSPITKVTKHARIRPACADALYHPFGRFVPQARNPYERGLARANMREWELLQRTCIGRNNALLLAVPKLVPTIAEA
jgi:hypothetical protein